MKHLTSLFATVSLVALSGCASIVSGSSQKVQVSTTPPTQSACTISNSLGNWSAIAPGQVDLKRSKTDLQVSCTDRASGYSGTSAVESDLEPWFLGNIIFGGIIGAPIDFMTGASWEYPNTVSVPLKPTYQPAAAYPSPATAAPVTSQAAPGYAPAAGAVYGSPATQAAPSYQYMPPSQPGAAAIR